MKAVIQRVVSASVAVDGRTISSIGKGLLVLVGIDRYDEPSDATRIIKKILTARLFDDDQGAFWKKNVKEIDGEVLCVSQFTLLANFKGSKPDFHESMSTIPGKAFYTNFMDEIKRAYHSDKIKDGEFGAMMQVSLTNDGPVTILLSSRDKEKPSKSSTPIESASPSTTPGGGSKPLGGGKKSKFNRSGISSTGVPTPTASSAISTATTPLDGQGSRSSPPEPSMVVAPVKPSEDGVDGLSDIVRNPEVSRTVVPVSVAVDVVEGEPNVDPSRSGGTRDDHHLVEVTNSAESGRSTGGKGDSEIVDGLNEKLEQQLAI